MSTLKTSYASPLVEVIEINIEKSFASDPRYPGYPGGEKPLSMYYEYWEMDY